MKIALNKKFIIIFSIIALFGFASKLVFAVWNGTFYEPGDTLNPECLPTDVDCDVRAPLTSLSGAVLTSQAIPQTVGSNTERLLKLWTKDLDITRTDSSGSGSTYGLNVSYTADTGSISPVGIQSIVTENGSAGVTTTLAAGAQNAVYLYHPSDASITQATGTVSSVLSYSAGFVEHMLGSNNQVGIFDNTHVGEFQSGWFGMTNYADASLFDLSAVVRVRARNYGAGTFTDLRGISLDGWYNVGTINTSYGIYMDSSIDVGATRYAIYSGSTSPSVLSGTLSASQFIGPVTALKSATTSIDISAAAAPSTGQVLTATDSTHAIWQNPVTPSSPMILTANSASEIPLTIKGAASQSANLFNIKDSSDNILLSASPTGELSLWSTTNEFRAWQSGLATYLYSYASDGTINFRTTAGYGPQVDNLVIERTNVYSRGRTEGNNSILTTLQARAYGAETPGVGFGVGIGLMASVSNRTETLQGSLQSRWTNAVLATRTSSVDLCAEDYNAERCTLTVAATGSAGEVQIGGGYGSTGVTISDAGAISADGAITSASLDTVGITAGGNASGVRMFNIDTANTQVSIGMAPSGGNYGPMLQVYSGWNDKRGGAAGLYAAYNGAPSVVVTHSYGWGTAGQHLLYMIGGGVGTPADGFFNDIVWDQYTVGGTQRTAAIDRVTMVESTDAIRTFARSFDVLDYAGTRTPLSLAATGTSSTVALAGATTATASLATDIPLTIKGAASQSANLQEWQDSTGAVVGSVGTAGEYTVSRASGYATTCEFCFYTGAGWYLYGNGRYGVYNGVAGSIFQVNGYGVRIPRDASYDHTTGNTIPNDNEDIDWQLAGSATRGEAVFRLDGADAGTAWTDTLTLTEGNVAANVALTVGGGYGSTGVTISDAGAIQSNSTVLAEGGIFTGISGSTATLAIYPDSEWLTSTFFTSGTGHTVYMGPNGGNRAGNAARSFRITDSMTPFQFYFDTTMENGQGSALEVFGNIAPWQTNRGSEQVLNIPYTINASASQNGTVTGIKLNATETALNGFSHNLMDLQVGSISKFLINNSGNLTAVGSGSFGGGYGSTGVTISDAGAIQADGALTVLTAGLPTTTQVGQLGVTGTASANGQGGYLSLMLGASNGTTYEMARDGWEWASYDSSARLGRRTFSTLNQSSAYQVLSLESTGGTNVGAKAAFSVSAGEQSGTTSRVGISSTVNPAAGSASPSILGVTYTINASGAQSGTVTGLNIAATETALNGFAHNLIDASVGGISKFSVSNTGQTYQVGGAGVRASLANAAGLYVPWVSGDATTTAYIGSTNASNDQTALTLNSYSGVVLSATQNYRTDTAAVGFYKSITAGTKPLVVFGTSSGPTAANVGLRNYYQGRDDIGTVRNLASETWYFPVHATATYTGARAFEVYDYNGTRTPLVLEATGSGADVKINGGYGSTGVTISDAGVIQADGALTVASASVVDLVSCGGVQTNGGGTMSCTSDERLKDLHGDFTAGLADIMKINPQTYSWKTDSGLYDGGINYYGFIAQNIEDAIPEAVNTNPAGYKQVNTSAILAATVNAIKELNLNLESIAPLDIENKKSFAERFFAKMVAWLGDATNGIAKIFTAEVETKLLCVSDEGGDKTCITKNQLDALLSGADVSPTSPPGPLSEGEGGTPPPSGEINPPEDGQGGGEVVPEEILEPESSPEPALEATPEPTPEPTLEAEPEPQPEDDPPLAETLEPEAVTP